ncbi:THO complex subunit 2-like isoform X1 [Acropora millepora]|uniref:THO complex subunit 2-like isoform X1 n=1 Tax=Acropora millepora TaxID=45264 RepID=UPI001CF56FE9|nr:THO complex subunit 2-like isoform X1 [Acropora millepora]
MAVMIVTSSALKNWEKSGKDEVLRLCKNCVRCKDGELYDSQFECGENDLKRIIYEVLCHVIQGNLKHDDVISLLSDVAEVHPGSSSLLADLFCILDVESQCAEDKPSRERFLSLVAASVGVVPEALLKERLDVETLDALGIVPSQKAFNQKYVRTKTKLFYKQQKFNLLREESEGYAKLVTELGQEISRHVTSSRALENIKSLIGRFNLDPNKTLDVLLDLFECRIELEDFFLPLLKSFMEKYESSALCHIMGFKFQFYKDQPDLPTPPSLFHLAALLIKHKLLQLDDLYPHLSPSDADIVTSDTAKIEEAKQEARKMNIAVLAEIAAANNEENSKDNNKENDKPSIAPDNQKFGICEALLMVGAWDYAQTILERLPSFAAVSHPAIASGLCKLIHTTVEPLYRRHSSKAARGRPYVPVAGGPPQCKLFTDLPQNVFPMLLHLGPHLSTDPILMAKILRISKGFMKDHPSVFEDKEQSSPQVEKVWCGLLTLLDEVLLPSISLLECNSSLAEELWAMMCRFPYELRYRLYGQWKNESYSSHPRMVLAKAATIKRAKYITKRLTKENVKPSGRQIGKLSHSNPGILFEYLLSQIQKYDNFIGPVVDSLKYLTPLAYDVLAYCIIEALANPERERLKHEDTNISEWLKSLAVFCGTVFRKYSIELTGLLQYVANQLKAGKSFDLLVLKEVVQKMSGIEISEEVTAAQLEALSGGELLRAEGGYFGQIRNTKKSSQRLRDTLLEGKLDLPLCLLMAQQRNGIVFFEDSERHLKLVGKLYDQCQDTLVQFGGFLATQLTAEEYESHLPSLEVLGHSYHLTPDVAFFLSRPMFVHQIETKYEDLKKSVETPKGKQLQQKQILQCYIDAVNTVMEPVFQSARLLQAPKVWNSISPQLYVTFWALSMFDLYVPTERYEQELNKLKLQLAQLEDNKDMPVSKKKKEKERCSLLAEKLKEELRQQEEHNQRVMASLKNERDSWLPAKATKSETITQFLQLCMFPRCVFTASDAVYCAKFVHMLHNLKTPNFSTLLCFDRVFSDISYTVASCTENEASRYGRFLCSMLEIVMRWHGDKKTYEKECGSYPGFVTVLRATDKRDNDKADHLDYENYRHVCHKWQYKLTKALVVCLESKDYTQIRNTIMVLTKILPYYPKVLNLGQALERRIDKICEEEKEKRQDIYVLALGYAGRLKAKKRDMVVEGEFHHKEKPPLAATPAVSQNEAVTVKQEKTESQSNSSVSAEATSKTTKNAEADVKPKTTVSIKKEQDGSKSSSPSTTKSDNASQAQKETAAKSAVGSSNSKSSGASTPSGTTSSRTIQPESPSRNSSNNKSVTTVSSTSSQPTSKSSSSSSSNSNPKTTKTSSTVKTESNGNGTEVVTTSKKTESGKQKVKEKEKDKEKDKDSSEKPKEKVKAEKSEKAKEQKSKEKEKERSKSKEKEGKEKTKERLKDKDKERSGNKSKYSSPAGVAESPKDGEYEKEAKRRKVDGISSPSSQENSPSQLGAGNESDSFKSPDNVERKSKVVEYEKEKTTKADRKRSSLEPGEGKEAKRSRKEESDAIIAVSKTSNSHGSESKPKVKSEPKVKLVRKAASDASPPAKKEKDKDKERDKEKEGKTATSKKKDSRYLEVKDIESKEEERSKKHHSRSASRSRRT